MTEYFGDLETAIKELFVNWNTSNVTLDYAKYFKECSPTTCTFVYDDKPSSAALVRNCSMFALPPPLSGANACASI